MERTNNSEIIKKIEEIIGKSLEPLKLEDIHKFDKGYCLDKKGNIIGLNLYDARISNISFVKNLSHLTHLDLTKNNISNLFPLTNIPHLTSLNLNRNKISDILPLTDLTNLSKLYLAENQITDLSPLDTLTNLREVWLYSNNISNLKPLRKLINLTSLDLKKNRISDISPLKKLSNLTSLNLNLNQIADISPISQLIKLKSLRLKNNNIHQLPIEWIHLDLEIKWEDDFEGGIILEGNPLEVPPVEIVKQGIEALTNYFKESQKEPGENVRLLHSKFLIVGSGEVGKTTLMKKLKDNNFQVEVGKEKTTHGINIVPWELECTFEEGDTETIKVHLWDFGGQNIYHTTHQFFLTKRSLYLVVWEPRRNEEIVPLEYWLNIIKLLGQESPVIVVMNKSDVRSKSIDQADLKKKFPNIVDFQQVSCVTGEGIDKLTGLIRQTFSGMPHLKDRLPKEWKLIRNNLKELDKNYISLDKYLEICRKYNLDQERALFLSDYLHDLGVILHFRQDRLLSPMVILKPEWTTDAVYTLLDTPDIEKKNGQFLFSDLKKYWNAIKYPLEKHPHLIKLMEKFELCFNLSGSDVYFIPELRPTEPPNIQFYSYQEPHALRFEYHYVFMPQGIVSRFIARHFLYINENHFWKNGVEVKSEDDNSTALVMGHPLKRKVEISAVGYSKNELLSIIRRDFDHIHKTLNMLKSDHYTEYIQCHCSQCSFSTEPFLFNYTEIKNPQTPNIPTIQCHKSYEMIEVSQLIKGIEAPEPQKIIFKALLECAVNLQGTERVEGSDENARTTHIASLLQSSGFYVKDQALWGRSSSGESKGELDIKIESTEEHPPAVIEAFNLKNLDRTVIDKHLKKLFGYDPTGLPQNYILVYSEAPDFTALWKKYLEYIPNINYPYPLLGNPQEITTVFAEIKVASISFNREEKKTLVYHIFINMKPKSSSNKNIKTPFRSEGGALVSSGLSPLTSIDIVEKKFGDTELIHKTQELNEKVEHKEASAVGITTTITKEAIGEFDVFLAHNSQEKTHVIALGEKLKERGLNPWIDTEQVPPGQWFQDILQQAIRNDIS